ncbi:MAG: hypothetical protein ACK5UC_03940 [Planctomycetaceae bacterium]|jgi:hypothetical protein
MRLRNIALSVVLAGCFPVATLGGTIFPPELSDSHVSQIISGFSTINVITTLALAENPDPNTFSGQWTGAVNATGWSLTFAGKSGYGVPTTIVETGILDRSAGLATWTDTGVFGIDVLTGTGTYEFDPTLTQVIVKATAVGLVAAAITGGAIAAGIVSGGTGTVVVAASAGFLTS